MMSKNYSSLDFNEILLRFGIRYVLMGSGGQIATSLPGISHPDEISDLYYSDSSNYDADLFLGMQIEIIFHNNDAEEKNIGINYVLHEVVAQS